MPDSLVALLLAAAALPAAPLPSRVSLGNEFLERTFEIHGGRVRTVSLVNKLDGRTYTVDSREFRLVIVWERLGYEHGRENPVTLTGADFTLERLDRKPGELVFETVNRQYNLGVNMRFTLAPGDFYVRKQLEITALSRAAVFLDQVAVEDLSIRGAAASHGGFGQPVYADGLFLGLEYPGGYNTAGEGRVALRYYSGETTGASPVRSERAVVGVAREGAVRDAFQDYIARIRSGPVRQTIVFNTWYDMQRDGLTAENCRRRMALLRKNLLDPYQIHLESFVLDDGWDDRNTVWNIHAQRFGGDFNAFSEALRRDGTALGLWFGPIGGYDQRGLRIAAGRREGYEITANGEYFCLAGTRYREKFKNTVLEMVRKYGVNHLKFDGIPYGCNAPGHGHLPGIYSREAHLRAFIDVLRAVRAADRRVFLNITTGNWLSPWWLQYADAVFMGGFDYGFLQGVPATSEREKAITYRDKILYDDFRTHGDQFPHNSLMTIGIIKGTLGGEGGLNESLGSWVRNAIMNFSRGSMFTELYVSPEILTGEEWKALGAVIRWARRNSDVLLRDTRMILGDPARREVYGYAHFGDRGIVTVRNPYVEEQTVAVALDDSAGLRPDGKKYRARVVYPYAGAIAGEFAYGDRVPLTVPGYEVLVVEFQPAGAPAEAAGARPRPAPGPAVRSSFRQMDGTLAAGVELTLVSPASLAVLWESDQAAPAAAPRFRVNGAAAKPQTISPGTTEARLGMGEGRWTFYLVPLAAGESRVEMELAAARGRLGAWLVAESAGLASSAPGGEDGLPLPAAPRQTVHLFTRAITAP